MVLQAEMVFTILYSLRMKKKNINWNLYSELPVKFSFVQRSGIRIMLYVSHIKVSVEDEIVQL